MKHRDEAAASTRPRIIGVVLAVVAAIAVPIALFAALRGGGEPADQTEPAPTTSATSAATPTESESAESESAEATPTQSETASVPDTFADIGRGPAPRIAWSDGTTLNRADGSTGTLPGGLREFALMGTGTLVSDGETVRYYSAAGAPGPRSYPLDGGLATSPQRQVVGWAGPDGSVTVVQGGGNERYDHPAISAEGPYDAVAITSDDCVEGRTTDAGCTVMVNTTGADPQAWVSTSHGFADRFNEDILQTTAHTDGVNAGITRIEDDGSTCSVVQSVTENRAAWDTCDFRLVDFSPDARHLFAVGSIGDGIGDGEVAILDAADGTVLGHVASTESTPAFVTQYAWEDARHVLMVMWTRGDWSIVRMALDGTLEYAVAPRAGQETEQPFFLRR